MKKSRMAGFWSFGKFLTLLALGIIVSIGDVSAKPPKKVIGGTKAILGEFPYLVSIRNGYPLCGGAILTERHILTAAHCILSPKTLTVVPNITNLEDPKAVVHKVGRVIRHPGYVPWSPTTAPDHDIALLVLAEPLKLDQYVQKINLPKYGAAIGSEAVFAGWGYISTNQTRTNDLMKFSVSVLPTDYCSGYAEQLPSLLCAYSPTGSICPGDSGSPLVYGSTVIGVASGSFCIVGYAHTYANVYKYRDWILTTLYYT